jgi:hypothetical protein
LLFKLGAEGKGSHRDAGEPIDEWKLPLFLGLADWLTLLEVIVIAGFSFSQSQYQ